MPTTTIYKSSAGFQNNTSGNYSDAEGMILSGVSSSQNAMENRALFYFDTQDSTTGIPSGAIIDSCVLGLWVNSHYVDATVEGFQYWSVYGETNGYSGTDITGSSWGYPSQFSLGGVTDWTNGAYNDFSYISGIRRTGYTVFGVYAFIEEGGAPRGWYMWADFYRNATQSGKLDITWHLPPAGGTLSMMGVG